MSQHVDYIYAFCIFIFISIFDNFFYIGYYNIIRSCFPFLQIPLIFLTAFFKFCGLYFLLIVLTCIAYACVYVYSYICVYTCIFLNVTSSVKASMWASSAGNLRTTQLYGCFLSIPHRITRMC